MGDGMSNGNGADRAGMPQRPITQQGAYGEPMACITLHRRMELLEEDKRQLRENDRRQQAEIEELRREVRELRERLRG